MILFVARVGRQLMGTGTALLLVALCHSAMAAQVLHAETIGACTVTLEAEKNWPTIALISRDGLESCTLDREATAGFLARAAEHLPEGRLFTSLFLGRLVRYPWLSAALAEGARGDPAWHAGKGRPAAGSDNAYVARALAGMDIVALVEAAFAPAGYRAGTPSIEKVLISAPGIRGLPAWVPADGHLPFDALCHITLTTPGGAGR